jgi:anti-sigma factor RsiW
MGDLKNAGRAGGPSPGPSRFAGAMTRAACGETRHALGVYVVGAIAPADRSAVEEHLADCADCRDGLAGLAGLPALLGRVPADEATRLLLDGDPVERPSQPGLVSLLGRAAQLRKHRAWPRWRLRRPPD